MSCAECIHQVVCKVRDLPNMFGLTGDGCAFFKNTANTLEVPDNDIIFTKDKWLVLNMESEYLGRAIKQTIDYCTKNARR